MTKYDFVETGLSSRFTSPEWKLVHVHSRVVEKRGWFKPVCKSKEVTLILEELIDQYGEDNCLVTASYRKLFDKKYEVIFEVWQHNIE